MLPASPALVGRLHPDPRGRARALGIWGGVATAGFAAGPLVGGLLISHVGWPSIFWINLPAAVLIGGTVALLAPVDRPRPRGFDLVGTVSAVVALAGLAGGIIEAGGGRTVPAVLLLVTGLLAGLAFVRLERRSRHRLVPAALIGSGTFRWALTTGFIFNFGMYGALLCISLTLQAAYGFSPFAAGLAVLPMALVVSVGATVSGFLAAAFGPRPPMITGFLLAGCGAVVIAAGGLTGSMPMIIGGLAVTGLCSLAMPAMTGVALNAAPPAHAGLAGGALNTARQMGGALGVAVLGALLAGNGFRVGFSTALVVTAAVSFIGALSTVRATRTTTGVRSQRDEERS